MCLIDFKIPKTAGMTGLKGLLSLLLQGTEGVANFEEVLIFICETVKSRHIRSLATFVIIDLRLGVPSFPVVFDLMMVLR